MDKERQERLKAIIRDANKKAGIETINFGTEEKEWEKIGFGIPPIDDILGGGIGRGRFSVLWGGKGSSKTTLAYYLTANAQKKGLTVYYVALEPFDMERAKQFGVDVDKLVLGRFPKAEQCLDTIIQMAKEKVVDVIILDSIHALSCTREQEDKKGEKSVADDSMALLASKLSQFFRMAGDAIYRSNIAVLMIGQTRMSIGGYCAFETLSGGAALHHYSKLIVHVARGRQADQPIEKIVTIDEEGKKHTETVPVGFDCRIKIDKTQTPGTKPELTEIHLPFKFANGFNDIIEIEKEIEEETKGGVNLPPPLETKPICTGCYNDQEKCDCDKENIKPSEEPKKRRGRPKKQ